MILALYLPQGYIEQSTLAKKILIKFPDYFVTFGGFFVAWLRTKYIYKYIEHINAGVFGQYI